jgi:hypothetical protein
MIYLKDSNFRMNMDYEFITEPPLLADIGTFEIDIQNMDIKVQVFFEFINGLLSLEISDLDFFVDPIFIDVDGMSDFS